MNPRPLLFRAEAVAHQQDKLGGTVLMAKQPTVNLLVWLVAAFALVLAAFAGGGQYTRKEHVRGYLAPTLGLMKVYTPQAGTVLEQRVTEGQPVRRGDVLLVISSERATASTTESQAAMLAELRQRRDSLRGELLKQGEIDGLGAQGLADRVKNLRSEIAEAQEQLALQRARVASAERTVKRHQELIAAHFVAEATLQQKQEDLIEQRQQLAQTQRSITSLTRELHEAHVELATAGLKRSNNAAAIERQISELEQQLTEGDARRSVVLTAPADGTVTTILAERGQAATPSTPLLSILPAGAQLQAQLLVPTRAAGFIKTGQQVALRYQAFPYQRFGHYLGEVVEVGRTVIHANEAALPLPVDEPVYRVTVRLPAQQVHAYGQLLPLQAGMAIDADVRIDKRRLIEWVFDPLLAIGGRV
jgi:membrane fusion protein